MQTIQKPLLTINLKLDVTDPAIKNRGKRAAQAAHQSPF